MLAVLTLINLFNYLDRQIIFPLFHNLQLEFGISDVQLGLLGTMFMLVHALTTVPFGMLADRYSRKIIIFAGVVFWSITSFASGLAGSFKALLGIRSLVGVGEAAYAPAATAMISDNFPETIRARVQSFFGLGMFIGGTFGAVLGALIVTKYGNWRHAFFVVSVPGIVLALLALTLRDTKRTAPVARQSFSPLFQNAEYLWILASGVMITFASAAFLAWGVEFMRRFGGYEIQTGSIILGGIALIAGPLGLFLGGVIADRLQQRVPWGRSILVAVSLILATPFMYFGLQYAHGGLLFISLFFVGTVFLSFYHGPVTAVMHDVVPEHLRATAFAFYLLVSHLFGSTLSPVIIGWVSDQRGLLFGLQFATIFVLISGLIFLPIPWLIARRARFSQSNLELP